MKQDKILKEINKVLMETMWASNLKMTITNNDITQMCLINLFLVENILSKLWGLKNIHRKYHLIMS